MPTTLNNNGRTFRASSRLPARQTGVVLIIALFVLVAMTLSAFSLIRSVNVTNLIAGNLAFRESALLYAEFATEKALNDWLIPNAAGGALFTDNSGAGYRASRSDPPANSNWGAFWEDTLEAQSVNANDPDAATAAGNTVRYVIHRLCEKEGMPFVIDDDSKCSQPPPNGDSGSHRPDKPPLGTGNQIYYRITAQVKGPRNTVVYTQTIITL